MHERQRSIASGIGFDVESNDHDQMYGGATGSSAAADAVRSTRGVVLMDGDKLLRAYFSSTCGGRTAAARETWPTGPGFEFNLAAPIQEHHREFACQNSPLFRWTVDRPRVELVKRLRAFGEKNGAAVRGLKDVRAIEVMFTNADGRPAKYRIIEPGGAWYQLSAEDLRIACNTSVSVAVNAEPASSVPVIAFESDSLAGAPPAVSIPDIDRKSRINSGDFEVVVKGEKVVFSGRGFGHGVGMCQYCAKGFAERGEDWRTMIARFYPGARVATLY
jgi:stage II sporulation protein D